METANATDNRLLGQLTLYDMHTDFFKFALDGIDDSSAQNRFGTQANHIAWLAGSLVQERFDLANWLGADVKQKNHTLFDGHKGIQDGIDYPKLDDFKADWVKISPILREILSAVPSGKLDETFEMGDIKMTNYEYISFQTYREANCIGQIALWRRLLGFPPMRYM
ncbi:DinB family protein [Flavobacterium selenitireducens]|uniref:DinB family protein n=1 Tax=Flavobacterium selenitireducens TaxID=2722704 RepID=UPI00168ABD38|nr:DinB family protein [Flavobacterium selenitireducens]MBD3583707.1 DinB family protein [Flavobacterium selenitireducens]